jgi:signal transduction histidine kinase
MFKKNHRFYNIFVFVTAQLAWLMVLLLWIYWYVSNYIIFEKVGDQLSPQITIDSPNVMVFVGGIILLVGVSFLMSLIFRHLSVQLKITSLYDNFIANVTHELKSPLSSIQLYLETLYSRDVPLNKQKEFLKLMMKDANRLNNLINTILEVSKLEQKKLAHDYHIYKGEQLVKELLSESAEQFKISEDKINVTGNLNCLCVADKDALKIVFDNLIDNSIKYTTDDLKIDVNLRCGHKTMLIELSDNGIGINNKDQKKIFNKFHRINNKRVPNVKGTGLGLYWVKEILRHHGGKISVHSRGTGYGTTFKIELPIHNESKQRFTKSLLKSTKKIKETEKLNEK